MTSSSSCVEPCQAGGCHVPSAVVVLPQQLPLTLTVQVVFADFAAAAGAGARGSAARRRCKFVDHQVARVVEGHAHRGVVLVGQRWVPVRPSSSHKVSRVDWVVEVVVV